MVRGTRDKAVREQLKAGADCIKLIATGGVLTKGAVPGIAQLTLEELVAGIEKRTVTACASRRTQSAPQGIKNALRAGVDSIEHGHLLDDEAIELFKANGAYLVPTLTAPTCILEHAQRRIAAGVRRAQSEALTEAMAENIRRAFEAGVKVAGGSDAGTPFNYHDNYAYEVELMHTHARHDAASSAARRNSRGRRTDRPASRSRRCR